MMMGITGFYIAIKELGAGILIRLPRRDDRTENRVGNVDDVQVVDT
jgi:hypothetical protein